MLFLTLTSLTTLRRARHGLPRSFLSSITSLNTMTTDSTPEDAQTGLYMPPSLAKRLELLDDVAVRALRQEVSLVHLYTAACLYQWDSLPTIASHVHRLDTSSDDSPSPSASATHKIQAAVRHLVVFCGYGPCLAAMTALKKADPVDTHDAHDADHHVPIPFDTPGKVSARSSGAPLSPASSPVPSSDSVPSLQGNAFRLVYHELSPKVRNTVYQADPVLENWIQNHLYGDVYSSPGLSMLSKQHLTIAGLVKSNMMDQLYGHALAALRFGGDVEFLKGIVDIVVHRQKQAVGRGARDDMERFERIGARSKRVVDMAIVKHARMKKDEADGGDEACVCALVNPAGTVCVPEM